MEKITELEDKRKELTFLIGQKKFHQEILTAEILQHCQEIVNINSEIQKAKKYSTPTSNVSPTLDVPPPVLVQEVQANV